MPSFLRHSCITISLALAAISPGCVRHRPPVAPPPPVARTYVDLQPGWRIRVVTPVLKSGKYMTEFKEMPSSTSAMELSAGDDFVGYETSYYRVTRARGSGIFIEFISSAVTIEGKESRKPRPIVRLFDIPASARRVRLVFLTRVSRADHNQAILAASELNDLDRLTELVQFDPPANCKTQANTYCEWVPEGIAVRAEKSDPAHRRKWIPAM